MPRLAGGTSLTDLAVDRHLAGGDFVEPADQPQQRGLSAARRADEGDEFAVFDREVDALQHLGGAEGFADVCSVQAWPSAVLFDFQPANICGAPAPLMPVSMENTLPESGASAKLRRREADASRW